MLVKEFQLDPIGSDLLHVDFYRLAMDKALTVTVPVSLAGEAVGVKQQGGLVDFVTREVQVECMPSEIPEHIEVDISELRVGDGVRLRDRSEGVAWKPVSDPRHAAGARAAAEGRRVRGRGRSGGRRRRSGGQGGA